MNASNIERLKELGFDSYQDYLLSRHWTEVRNRWRYSGKPRFCVACNSSDYELHHQSYANLGIETLADLVPLCRTCHQHVHQAHGNRSSAVRVGKGIMMNLFGWSEQEAVRRLRMIGIKATPQKSKNRKPYWARRRESRGQN